MVDLSIYFVHEHPPFVVGIQFTDIVCSGRCLVQRRVPFGYGSQQRISPPRLQDMMPGLETQFEEILGGTVGARP
jgi:hypothetical protein